MVAVTHTDDAFVVLMNDRREPMEDKYQATRRARELSGKSQEGVPCYAVRVSEGWIAIFGGLGETVALVFDHEGDVKDMGWIE